MATNTQFTTDQTASSATAEFDLNAAGLVTVQTTRFGTLEIEPERVMRFDGGLLGFADATRFALIETGDDSYFFWLQSLHDPALAFVVCDPQSFVPGYTVAEVPLRAECREALGIDADARGEELAGQAQVLTICNRVGDWLTGNLLGPLVVNVHTFVGQQIVLTEKRWSTRQPLMRLGSDLSGSGDVAGDGQIEMQRQRAA